MNPDCRTQDQHNFNEPSTLYVKAWEINRWKCWVTEESNPGPLSPAASSLTTEASTIELILPIERDFKMTSG